MILIESPEIKNIARRCLFSFGKEYEKIGKFEVRVVSDSLHISIRSKTKWLAPKKRYFVGWLPIESSTIFIYDDFSILREEVKNFVSETLVEELNRREDLVRDKAAKFKQELNIAAQNFLKESYR